MANDLLLQVCFKPYGCSTSFIYRPNHHHKGEAAHTDQVCPNSTIGSGSRFGLQLFPPMSWLCWGSLVPPPPRRKPSRKERRIASRTAVWTSLWNWQRWQIWLRLPRATPSHPFSFVSMVSQADKGRHCENNIESFTFRQIFRFEIPGIACGEWNSISQLVGLTRPRSSDVSGEDDDVTFYQWSKLLHA